MHRIVVRLSRVFSGPRGIALTALIGIVLTLPSLGAGWLVDDHWHRLALTGRHDAFELGVLKSGNVWDLFAFLDGDPERNRKLRNLGVVPWWTYDRTKGSFCRPVTSATHVIDYRFWPDHAWFMHLQSVAWYGALLAVTAALYKRIDGTMAGAAGLAALLYAVSDVHGMPVGFLANRNALIAGFFGVLSIIAHDRWRRDAWPPGALLAPLLFIIALFAKEAAAAIGGYLLAYAWFLDRAPRRLAILTILPYAVCLFVWRWSWSAMGYGIMPHVDLYIDPAVEPLRYLLNVFQRLPILLMGQLGVSADTAMLAMSFNRSWVALVSIVAGLLVALVALIVLPRIPNDKRTRFWITGTLLAGLPACTAFPSDRMLTFIGFGVMALLARAFLANAPASSGVIGPRLARIVMGFLIVRHLVIAPPALALRSAMPAGPKRVLDALTVDIPLPDGVSEQTVVIASAPVAMFAGQLPAVRANEGLPIPKHTRVLSPSGVTVTLTRPDTRTLVVRPDGGFLRWFLDEIFRDRGHPMALGEQVQMPDVTVTVTDLTHDGRPAEAAFRFEKPLDSDAFLWLRWSYADRMFIPLEPPEIGQETHLPGLSVR